MPLELLVVERVDTASKEDIAKIYARADSERTLGSSIAPSTLKQLCLSHEQLRADLEILHENRERLSRNSVPAQSVNQAAANPTDCCSVMPDKSQDIERKYRVWTVGGNEFKRSEVMSFELAKSVKNLIPGSEFEAVMILEDGRMPRD